MRVSWERRAQKPGPGGKEARRKLEGPPFPASLDWLWDWFLQLDRARGETVNGVATITHGPIHEWSRLTGRRLGDHEIDALIALDLVTRYPDPRSTRKGP